MFYALKTQLRRPAELHMPHSADLPAQTCKWVAAGFRVAPHCHSRTSNPISLPNTLYRKTGCGGCDVAAHLAGW